MAKFSDATLDFMKHVVSENRPSSDLTELPAKNYRHQFMHDCIKNAYVELEEDINVLELKNLLFERFDSDWLEWYPEVLSKTLFDRDLDNILTDKMQAIRICYKSDAPWTEWDIFENVGKAFNNQKPNFGFIQPLSLGECAATAELMSKLRPEEIFSDEVLSYVGSVAASENYLYIPEDYKIAAAQKYLDKFVHDKKTQEEISLLWVKIKKRPLLTVEYREDSLLHQQIAKLAILDQFVKENAYA